MSIKRRWRCALAASMALLVLNCVLPRAAAAQHRTVKVAVAEAAVDTDWDNLSAMDAYNREYLSRLAQFTGWKVEYVVCGGEDIGQALQECMRLVETGEADLLGSVVRTEALEERFAFPRHNSGMAYTVLSALESNTEISRSNDSLFCPLRVAVLEGDDDRNQELAAFLTALEVPYETIPLKGVEEQIAALEQGRADVMLRVSVNDLAGVKEIVRFAPRPFYFVTGQGNGAVARELDEGIAQMTAVFPDMAETLYDRHFSNARARFYMTDAEQHYVRKEKSLRVLCIPDCAPFAFAGAQGEPCGIAVSILESLAAKTGLKLEFEMLAPGEPNGMERIASGDFDCVLGIPLDDALYTQLGMIASRPYMQVDTVIFNNAASLKKPAAERVAAVIRHAAPAMESAVRQTRYYENTAACLRAVASGEADCGFGNRRCVEYYAYENFCNLSVVPLDGRNQEMTIAISGEADPRLLMLVNRYLKTLTDEDIYAFASDASAHTEVSALERFIRTNPMQAACYIAVCACGLFAALALFFVARSRKKRSAELERAVHAKSDFLSRMSHDIRTPMNGILGLTSLTMEVEGLPSEARKNLCEIQRSGAYLLSLLNDTLEMSKMESDKVVLHLEPVQFAEIIQDLEAYIRPMAKARGVRLVLAVTGPQGAWTLLDRMRLKQIYINLLSNAIKFTPPGGQVEFRAELKYRKDGKLGVKTLVKDNGIGMSAAFLPHLYEPFEQEARGLDDNREGTGLGMAIVHALVTLMQGSIQVESAPGEGTLFTLEMSFVCAQAEEDRPQPAFAGEGNLAGRCVLLCEDHPVNAHIAQRILEKKGVLCKHAENGRRAVEMFTASPIGEYDAVLMDIRMPEMDGIQAAAAIRALDRPDARAIPIIAMTANAFDEDVRRSLEAGMDAHLAKPVDPQLMVATLAQWMGKDHASWPAAS